MGITGITAAALVGGALIGGAAAAQAQDVVAGPGSGSSFTLTNTDPVAQLRYAHARELQICDATSNSTGTTTPLAEVQYEASQGRYLPLVNAPVPFGGPASVPLQVHYHGMTQQIAPGECYRLHASHVTIAAAGPVRPGTMVQGTAEWVAANP